MRPVPPGTGPKAALLIAMGVIIWRQSPGLRGYWVRGVWQQLIEDTDTWLFWPGGDNSTLLSGEGAEAYGLDCLAEL